MTNNAIHIQSPFLPSAFLRQSGSVSMAIHLSPQMALHLACRNKALASLQSSRTTARCLLIQHMLTKWPRLLGLHAPPLDLPPRLGARATGYTGAMRWLYMGRVGAMWLDGRCNAIDSISRKYDDESTVLIMDRRRKILDSLLEYIFYF